MTDDEAFLRFVETTASIRADASRRRRLRPDVAWRWGKWTFGVWVDRANKTLFGIDVGPLEIVWRAEGYRP